MKVLLLTVGTRGDAQPFVALAQTLKGNGHDVQLGIPSAHSHLAITYGIPHTPIYDPTQEVLAAPSVRSAITNDKHSIQYFMRSIPRYQRRIAQLLDDTVALARASYDILVYHPLIPGNQIAEWLNVPSVPVAFQPFLAPTSKFPNPLFPLRVPHRFYWHTYLYSRLIIRLHQGSTSRWRRQELGLPKRRRQGDILRQPDGRRPSLIQAFSPIILPDQTHFPKWVHTTGFWLLSENSGWTPPKQLSEFISQGSPPVYIGFGSMTGLNSDPQTTSRIVTQAARNARVRAVISAGDADVGIKEIDRDVLTIGQVPHSWIFPRVSAIVHHGGSGTTGAALAAGRPQVICPYAMDQPFFAQRMHQLGTASAPIPQRRLTAASLAEAIHQAAFSTTMAAQARKLGDQMRSEEALSAAVNVLQSACERA